MLWKEDTLKKRISVKGFDVKRVFKKPFNVSQGASPVTACLDGNLFDSFPAH